MNIPEDYSVYFRTAGRCHKCQNYTDNIDGSKVGGLPRLIYQNCRACGWNRTVTKKQKKMTLKKEKD